LDFGSFRLVYGLARASGIVGECFASNPNVEMILNTWLLKRIDKQRLSLASLLRETKGLSATDPRDEIFALLGLADVGFSELFIPNYSFSVSETYISFTRAIIKDSGSLSILADAYRESPDPDLPSWVPDWRARPLTNSIHESKVYNINLGYRSQYDQLETFPQTHLTLPGAHLDEVSKIYDLDDLCHSLGQAADTDF
jgi:hypothetical protein